MVKVRLCGRYCAAAYLTSAIDAAASLKTPRLHAWFRTEDASQVVKFGQAGSAGNDVVEGVWLPAT